MFFPPKIIDSMVIPYECIYTYTNYEKKKININVLIITQ